MTESLGDDAAASFFAEEAAREQAMLEATKSNELHRWEILAALDKNGAPHIWHPDGAVMNANREVVVRLLQEADTVVGQSGADLSSEERASTQLSSEVTMVTTIGMYLVVKGVVKDAVIEQRQKKTLLARLIIDGFGEEWQAAVGDLMEGEKLDLSREEDMQIYLDVTMEQIAGRTSLEDAILGILADPSTEVSGQVLRHSPLSVNLCFVIIKAQRGIMSRPEFESYVDEKVREGAFGETQGAQLRELVDNHEL